MNRHIILALVLYSCVTDSIEHPVGSTKTSKPGLGQLGNQLRHSLMDYIQKVKKSLDERPLKISMNIVEDKSDIVPQASVEYLNLEKIAKDFIALVRSRPADDFKSPPEKFKTYQTFYDQLNQRSQDLEKLRERISRIEQRVVPNLIDSLTSTYKANFLQFPEIKDLKGIYSFIKLTDDLGMSMTYKQIQNHIKDWAPKYKPEKSQELIRQLNYIFRDETSKNQYDLYISGNLEIKVADKNVPERLKIRRNEISGIKSYLSQIQRELTKKGIGSLKK